MPLMGPKLTQAEGFILGVGAKMFTIAGPVIVYSTVASVVYGIIYFNRINTLHIIRTLWLSNKLTHILSKTKRRRRLRVLRL